MADRRRRYTDFFTAATPNSSIPDCTTGIDTGIFAARSHHPGGVNASMADGSVRFFGNGIDPAVWHALGSRNGGDVVTLETTTITRSLASRGASSR